MLQGHDIAPLTYSSPAYSRYAGDVGGSLGGRCPGSAGSLHCSYSPAEGSFRLHVSLRQLVFASVTHGFRIVKLRLQLLSQRRPQPRSLSIGLLICNSRHTALSTYQSLFQVRHTAG